MPLPSIRKQEMLYTQTAARLENFVRLIYYNSLNTREITYYCYAIPPNDSFYKTNMLKILARLSSLFPDSKVVHTLLAIGSDGKYYDIEKLSEDALSKVNVALDQSYILIDWS